MAKLTNNDNETIEIATDEDVYIPIASTQTVGVAKFSPDDFAVSQDGQVTSLQKVGGIQYFGIIVSQSDDGNTLEWQLVEESDDNTDYPRVGAKILLKTDFEGVDRIHNAGEVYVITSIDNYDVSTRTPVYTDSEYLTSYKGDTATVKVHSTTTLKAGSNATVVNVGTDEAAQLDFGIPGSPTVEVSDTVIPLKPAVTPIVTNIGDEYAVKLQFSIPTTQKIVGTNLNLLNTWEEGSIEVNEEQSTETELVLDFNIPRGYPGQSFHIDDQVYTTGDLPAATEDNIGRVYVVGDAVPYSMYVCIYDEDTSTYQWLNLGHIIGIKSVDKTTVGLTDTYTVTMDDGYTFQFTITNGAQGAAGVGLKSVTELYLATDKSSGVTTSKDDWDWQTTIPTISGTNRYLWNYEVVEYTDGTSTTTDPALIGTWGVGISSVTNYYGLSTSTSSEPTTWYPYPVTMTSTWKYLWNYEVVVYEDTTEVKTEPAIIGVYGDKGDTGNDGSNGSDGADGADGVGISTITKYYLVSTDNTGVTTDTEGWDTNVPTMTSTYKYLWNYDVIVYTDGSEQLTTPVVIGVYGDTGDTGDTGIKGDTVSIVRLYHLATSGTAYAGITYDYDTAISTGGFTTDFQSVTTDYMYEFVLEYTKTVTYDSSGNVASTSYSPSYVTPVICAKYGLDGADGTDAYVTAENVYNALTENDTIFGCFYDDDGKLYIKAEFIKSGQVTSDITYTGSLIATNADISGTITSSTGTIGGFTIGSSSLYTNSKTSYSSTTTGVYLGNDGIGLGAGTFYVTSSGYLYSTSGSIGGFIISSTSLIYSGSISLNGAEKTLYLFADTGGVNGSHVEIDYDGLASVYRISGGTTTYPYEMLQVYAGNGLIEKYYSAASGTRNTFHLYLDSSNEYLPTLQGITEVDTGSSTTITYDFYIASNLIPTDTYTYTIGAFTTPWSNIYTRTLNFVDTYKNISIDINNSSSSIGTSSAGCSVYIGGNMQDIISNYNTLIGYNNGSYATNSVLIGYRNLLMYDTTTDLDITHTVLIGQSNLSYDKRSVCIGSANGCYHAAIPTSSEGYNEVIGYGNTIYGIYDVAIGYTNTIGTSSTTYMGCVCVGRSNTCTSNYEVRLGYSGTTSTLYVGGTQFTSDERDKIDIQDYDDDKSLEFILSLRTISYVDNARAYYEYMDTNDDGEEVPSELHREYGLGYYDTEAHAAGTKKGSRRRSGVLAQDVTEQMQNVFGDSDYVNIVNDSLNNKIANGETIPEGIESSKTVSYTSFIPFLISAMRAQQKQIEALQEAINNLQGGE